ncbi:MAG: hypothetical protein LBV54_00435 [Puniceicoccales bacterium]|nr:hypothetical protein [Puniceicoccales bacterium]
MANATEAASARKSKITKGTFSLVSSSSPKFCSTAPNLGVEAAATAAPGGRAYGARGAPPGGGGGNADIPAPVGGAGTAGVGGTGGKAEEPAGETSGRETLSLGAKGALGVIDGGLGAGVLSINEKTYLKVGDDG